MSYFSPYWRYLIFPAIISVQLVNKAFNKSKNLERAIFAYVVFQIVDIVEDPNYYPKNSSSWYLASISIGVRHHQRRYLVTTEIHFRSPHRGRNFS